MYLEHFGFREFPFSLTPDTEYFYAAGSHRDALNVLHLALRSGEGFMAVTAEVGLGKTLLCRLLLRELDAQFATAYIPDPQLSPRALRVALAEELGLTVARHSTDEQLLRQVRDHLLSEARAGRRVVVLLDEAHELPHDALESVRLLTNLETEKAKLLQVVLVGQPELDRRLDQPALRQLRQRIGFRCTLAPLDQAGTATYIAHRLSVAAVGDGPVFTPRAIAAIHAASAGTPRVINLLCHKALMAAFGRGATRIDRAHARRAIADSAHVTAGAAARRPAWRDWLAARRGAIA